MLWFYNLYSYTIVYLSDLFQLRGKIKQLEEEVEAAKMTVSSLRKELDHFTVSHSQILVENTKLMNDKLRFEQEMRKQENQYEITVQSLHDKFSKEVSGFRLIPRKCFVFPVRVRHYSHVTWSLCRYLISIRSTNRIEQECRNSKWQIKNSDDTWQCARLAIQLQARAAYRQYQQTLRLSKLAKIFYKNINLITLVNRQFLTFSTAV